MFSWHALFFFAIVPVNVIIFQMDFLFVAEIQGPSIQSNNSCH